MGLRQIKKGNLEEKVKELEKENKELKDSMNQSNISMTMMLAALESKIDKNE